LTATAPVLRRQRHGKTTVFNAPYLAAFWKGQHWSKELHAEDKGPDGTFTTRPRSRGNIQANRRQDRNPAQGLPRSLQKKRGSSTEEFDGHTTDYFIDGVPSNEKEYSATMIALCGGSPEKMKMLTMPNYFQKK